MCRTSSKITGMICIDLVLILFFLFISLILALSFSEWPLINQNGSILITGSSSGIGLSAAKRLHSEGFHIYAAYRKEKDFHMLQTLGLTPILLDVTNSKQIDDAVNTIKQSKYPLVGIINNAGSTTKKPLEFVTMSKVKQVFDVNVLGALEVTQKFLPLLRETINTKGMQDEENTDTGSGIDGIGKYNGARIVFIGSVSGIISLPLNGVYSMTKYSMEAMADTFRRELYKFGIAVSMVNPAYVNTNFRQKGEATIQNLDEKEKEFYGQEFNKLEKKMKKRIGFAAKCCDVTDDAIVDAIMSKYPRTRYYPAVVAPHVPAWVMTPIIRMFGVFTFTDRLLDLVVLRFF